MEEINHRMVRVNGISMHIAEKGQGCGYPVVLFLHGFPELWYSWRHQILSLSALGYHAVAPDLRGYGDTDSPPSSGSYTCHHIVGDLVALIEQLGVDRVFLVAHDWGAIIGWYLCMFRPDRVKAYVCLGVPFRPRNPARKPVETLRLAFGDDYYMCRFQEPGAIEAEIERVGAVEILKKILASRSPDLPILPKENPFQVSKETPTVLPPWLTEEDITFYATKFNQTGFTGALNYYRALDESWELSAPWQSAEVKVPVKFIVGDLDVVFCTPGMKEFIQGGMFKRFVPMLDDVVVMEGVAHFINQERPEEISAHIHDYIKQH